MSLLLHFRGLWLTQRIVNELRTIKYNRKNLYNANTDENKTNNEKLKTVVIQYAGVTLNFSLKIISISFSIHYFYYLFLHKRFRFFVTLVFDHTFHFELQKLI